MDRFRKYGVKRLLTNTGKEFPGLVRIIEIINHDSFSLFTCSQPENWSVRANLCREIDLKTCVIMQAKLML